MRNVTLILDDGTRFSGQSFGYEKPVAGEVVFNTAMTGYPESLTDPSYAGQLMTLTYPLVGNYGVPPFTIEGNGLATFMESEKIHAEAIIVSNYSENYSHWNAVESLADWLKREHVPGITGIDTRELTKVLREHGVMMGKIVFDDEPDNIPEATYAGVNYVDRVSCKEVIRYNEGAGKKVVLVDCGVKTNILRCLLRAAWRSFVCLGTTTSTSCSSTASSSPTDRATPTRAMPPCRTSVAPCRTKSSPSSASAWATSSSRRQAEPRYTS